MAVPQPIPILELGEKYYDAVTPAEFPTCTPRFLNWRWAQRVGLGDLSDEGWARHFCRFEPLPGNLAQPLALRYHGHQFRVYNPDIGDGRGFLFAQLRDDCDRLLDFGTKGSGQTPYSRHADGRLTLKGGVREVLATEMLEALGVNTSRTFALFETGEELDRGDEPSPTRSAVLTRLSHGHIRIGTFQRLAFFGQADILRKLVRYCLANLYDEPPAADDAANALRLFDLVGQPPPNLPHPISPRASSTASSTATTSTSPARASITARGASRRSGTRTSPPHTSTITASTPSAGSRRRSTGTSHSLRGACRSSLTRRICPSCLAGGAPGSKPRWSWR